MQNQSYSCNSSRNSKTTLFYHVSITPNDFEISKRSDSLQVLKTGLKISHQTHTFLCGDIGRYS